LFQGRLNDRNSFMLTGDATALADTIRGNLGREEQGLSFR
jgi:hypothetical protein